MREWEYLRLITDGQFIITIDKEGFLNKPGEKKEFLPTLNELGKEGWEMTGIAPSKSGLLTMVMKKETTS